MPVLKSDCNYNSTFFQYVKQFQHNIFNYTSTTYLGSVSQEYIQPYILSITIMEADHVLEVAKDAGGARVIEAFLSSDASAKLKRRLVAKYVF